MIRILIVEDEITIARLIDLNLSACGYECTCEYDGLAAADLLEQMSFDLILLDIMLPGADGFELMDLIRPTKTPVIFLTARGSVSDRVNGLRAGADDYLVKPFDIVELIARVESVLRRTGKTGDQYTVGDVCIDARAMRVTRGGEPILLTPKEFDLLVFLAANKGIALSREKILQQVWNYDYFGEDRTVDTHVKMLRSHLGKYRDFITTVWGVGYKFEPKAGV